MASRRWIPPEKIAIHLRITRRMIFCLKDWLISLSQGSINDYLYRANVRVNQSMEYHLRDGQSRDCEFRLILESKRLATDKLHS